MKTTYPGLATFVTVMLPGRGVAAAVGRMLADRGGSLGLRASGRVSATFHDDCDAVAAALAVRTALPSTMVSVHTGLAHVPGGAGYPGPAVRHGERLCEIANPGQVLVSAHTARAVADRLPGGVSLHDLGQHRLRDLGPAERVFELRDASMTGAEPLRSLDSVPNNLPVELSPFVGRGPELAEVTALLTGSRLVTLTGTGGVGKTRLAAQVAAEAADGWPGGVWWVELAGVSDSAEVSEVAASSIGVLADHSGNQVRSLAVQLRDRKVLVCLDNCEHVAEGAAELAETLVRSCPEVEVLATSRQPLNVPGEMTWQVPPLTTDEAVALFVERAGAVRPYFAVDESSERAIRSMCRRLDGIPLALELAAAWMRILTPAQVEQGLDDRFDLLVRSPRGVSGRHQTLAASIDWSHNLLEEVERRVFRRLAIFAAGFDLEAALAVCSDAATDRAAIMQALGRLVDASLVVVEQRIGESRYRLLETIRAYATDRLVEAGEDSVIRDRHLNHYLAVAEAAEPELDRDKDAWRAQMEPERDNLRAALDWGLAAPDPHRGRRLAAALAWLWNLRATAHEGITYLRRAIDRDPQDRTLLQARLLTGYALVADTVAPLDLHATQRGLELATELGDDRLRGRCLAMTALGRLFTDIDDAWDLSVRAQQVADTADDRYGFDSARALQSLILVLRDRHDDATPILQDVVDSLTRRGDRGIAATILGAYSSSALVTGQIALARDLAEVAVRTAKPLGDYFRVGMARGQLATVLGVSGDIDAGLQLLEPFVRLVDSDPAGTFVPGLGMVIGELHRLRGEFDEALRWLERDVSKDGPAADHYVAAITLPTYGAALLGAGRRDEAAESLERALVLARRFNLPRYLSDALEQLGRLAEADDPDRAADLQHEALAVRVEHGLRLRYIPSLEALGPVLARTGRQAEAARLLAAADRARIEIGCPRPPADRPAFDTLAGRLRTDPGSASAWDEGAKPDLDLDAAVAYARRMRGTRGRPDSGWASLTPTELDVVRLAADGLTNPQIGAQLFMSRSTVKTHLAHVYVKLGLSNRTELAAVAASHRRLDEVSRPAGR